MIVKLTYFKQSGKFYTEGEFSIPESSGMLDAWARVEEMQAEGRLPGLVDNAREFIVLIRVPDHPADHPRLIFPPPNTFGFS